MRKQNCWEYKRCGREAGGRNARELGVCPVAVQEDLAGAHGGKKAGRACWVVAGSLCGGKVQGSYAQKLADCWRCDFLSAVKTEESTSCGGFSLTRLGMERAMNRGGS
jgi:hypothetical protein